jgi:hypothetical protein
VAPIVADQVFSGILHVIGEELENNCGFEKNGHTAETKNLLGKVSAEKQCEP